MGISHYFIGPKVDVASNDSSFRFFTVDAEATFPSCWDDDSREMNDERVSLNGYLPVIAV